MKTISKIIFLGLLLSSSLFAQKPYRYGTTAANFLEIGIGPAVAMGEAYVSVGNNISSIYWNPAGLAFQEQPELIVMDQAWVAGIANRYAAVAITVPNVGNIGLSMNHVDFGSIAVTNLRYQDGTGEFYQASEYAMALTYARSIVNWFSFGISTKYVSSTIWHSGASALALDLGVAIVTDFFSPTGNQEEGMRIGMSISNYGSKMSYSGIDMLNVIDIEPDEAGNYSTVQGEYKTDSWDLPVIFRAGVSFYPFYTHKHNLLVAMDVLHPNNNSESINLGLQYDMAFIRGTHIFLRTGLRGMYLYNGDEELNFFDSAIPYSAFTYGGGIEYNLFGRQAIALDYAYRSMGLLGYANSFTLTYQF
ncbi:MAG: PorV/PorQ family protein [Candidatus Marinimicrobia bacterium]|jgi:hypothetical protein|nr:PorV/PorQ family protein [Candidatus Neomarinimicrobiota bacterium]MBT3576581.1 PorV/PorQ family protein [Candidatus Neomarinimicrobiota bacterium]MBT3680187.1 PorV/PorQ family protein [Candidatus Neomarinimicrobiota bacterium]MBT3949834.1 PorV/PorQ family protein [Candidatus Neomarinimicrobiota bacterium]MBT4253556.1 PorV/PorQ family protein [Candidatus Neomarinimicrobiota bacterium]